MIYRTYEPIASGMKTTANVGFLPGSMADKVETIWKQTEEYHITEELGIEWLNTAQRCFHNIDALNEIILRMSEHQHTLWRIAGGDRYCFTNEQNGMAKDRRMFNGSIENDVGEILAPHGYEPTFTDGTVNFVRGDQMVSVYPDGRFRILKWSMAAPTVAYIYPHDGARAALKHFSFLF